MLETINILKKKFINYAREGMLNEMKEINDSIKLTNDTFNEALRFASIYGNLEVAKYLVSLGADDFNSALIKASECDNLEVIKYLKECIENKNSENINELVKYLKLSDYKEAFKYVHHGNINDEVDNWVKNNIEIYKLVNQILMCKFEN